MKSLEQTYHGVRYTFRRGQTVETVACINYLAQGVADMQHEALDNSGDRGIKTVCWITVETEL